MDNFMRLVIIEKLIGKMDDNTQEINQNTGKKERQRNGD